MITSKYITPLVAVIMVIAVFFTGTAMALHISDSTASAAVQKEYVSKVFDKDTVMNINIEMVQDDWDWIIENASNEEYRSCNITINGKTYYNVGIRPKGNSSLSQVARDENTDRFSFKISFDEYVKGQTLYGLSSLALNNVMSDASYMKEYLSYDLMASMDVASPAFAYSNITVNDKPWGLYLAVEIIDESLLERYFGTGDYNLYKPEGMDMAKGGEFSKMQEIQQNLKNDQNVPNAQDSKQQNNKAQFGDKAAGGQPPGDVAGGGMRQGGKGGMGASGGSNLKYTDDNQSSYSVIRNGAVLKTTDDEDFEKVVTMIKALNSGENLEEYLDVDEILRYFAVNTFLVNLDSYSGGMYHNYYLFEEDGVFQILPWDFNLSFAGFGIQDAQKAVNFPIDSPTTDSLENAPLIGKLLEVPEYKELYHKYLNQIVTDYVGSGKFEQNVTKLKALIGEYVKSDATAFFTYEQYQNALPTLVQLAKDRALSVKAQLSGSQPSDSYGSISTNVNLQTLGSMGGGGGKAFGNNQQGAQQVPGGNNQQGAQQVPGGNNQQGGRQVPGGNNQQGAQQVPDGNNQQRPQAGGQQPQANANGNDQVNPIGGAMIDREVMSKVFEIMASSNGGELTETQLSKLKELGLTEEQISQMKNMAAGGLKAGMGGQPPEAFNPNQQTNRNFFSEGAVNSNSSEYMIITLSCVVLLAGGILFAWKFKRKRYKVTK